MYLVILGNSPILHLFKLIFFLGIQNHDTYSQYKFQLNCKYRWWDIDVTKNHEKWPFLTIVPSEKYKYLNNGTIFFQTAWVTILRTLTSKTRIRLNEIGGPRLSSLCGSRSWLTYMDWLVKHQNRKNRIKVSSIKLKLSELTISFVLYDCWRLHVK